MLFSLLYSIYISTTSTHNAYIHTLRTYIYIHKHTYIHPDIHHTFIHHSRLGLISMPSAPPRSGSSRSLFCSWCRCWAPSLQHLSCLELLWISPAFPESAPHTHRPGLSLRVCQADHLHHPSCPPPSHHLPLRPSQGSECQQQQSMHIIGPWFSWQGQFTDVSICHWLANICTNCPYHCARAANWNTLHT